MNVFKQLYKNISSHKVLLFLIALACANIAFSYKIGPNDELITDFETQPFNRFGGVIGTYGANIGSGYTDTQAHSGSKSFKLFFSKNIPPAEEEHHVEYKPYGLQMVKSKRTTTPHKIKNVDWAVFVMDLGPITNAAADPVEIKPYDLSEYSELVLWVKGEKGGENFRIYLRDTNALTYEPQLKINPHTLIQNKWRPISIKLRRIKRKIDLTRMVQIGVGFGKEDGNRVGNIMYIDDFILVK